MVRHPGHPLDHLGDARKRPQVVVEPGRHRPALQHPADLAQLTGAELGRLALAGGAHPSRTAIAPAGIPAAGGLRRHAQLTGDLGAGLALGEQVSGLQPAAFQPLQISGVSEHPALGVTAARLMPGSITRGNHQLPRTSVTRPTQLRETGGNQPLGGSHGNQAGLGG
jgi:hypothetical protein